MTDRDRILAALDCCGRQQIVCPDECPYIPACGKYPFAQLARDAAALIRGDEPAPAPEPTEHRAIQACHHCEADIGRDDYYCRYCGRKLRDDPPDI